MIRNPWTLVLNNTFTITTLLLFLMLRTAYSQSPVAPSPVEFQVNWLEMSKIDKGAIKSFNGRFALAVSVSMLSNLSDTTTIFNRDNTKIVFTDGSESNMWLAWFPELKGYDFDIRGKGGSMTDPQVVFADDNHNRKYGRPYGGESYLEIGGEAGITGVYHTEKNGKLIVHFAKPKISRNPIFLFPLQSKQLHEIAMIKLGDLKDVTISSETPIKSFNNK